MGVQRDRSRNMCGRTLLGRKTQGQVGYGSRSVNIISLDTL